VHTGAHNGLRVETRTSNSGSTTTRRFYPRSIYLIYLNIENPSSALSKHRIQRRTIHLLESSNRSKNGSQTETLNLSLS